MIWETGVPLFTSAIDPFTGTSTTTACVAVVGPFDVNGGVDGRLGNVVVVVAGTVVVVVPGATVVDVVVVTGAVVVVVVGATVVDVVVGAVVVVVEVEVVVVVGGAVISSCMVVLPRFPYVSLTVAVTVYVLKPSAVGVTTHVPPG
jgi:hypothetical protein